MNKMIISIGREHGSGGHEIAEKIAEHFGIAFYDTNIIEEITGQNSMAGKKTAADERLTGKILSGAGRGASNRQRQELMNKLSKSDVMYQAQSRFINHLTETESFVIVGHAGNAILENHPDAMRFFIYAPEKEKIHRIMKQNGVSMDTARKEIMQVDKQRKKYFEYYSKLTWGSTDGHDIMIDSSIFGIDETARIMEKLIAKRFGMEMAG